jgi:hypothetical protein
MELSITNIPTDSIQNTFHMSTITNMATVRILEVTDMTYPTYVRFEVLTAVKTRRYWSYAL